MRKEGVVRFIWLLLLFIELCIPPIVGSFRRTGVGLILPGSFKARTF